MDRNKDRVVSKRVANQSPPARVAWIETELPALPLLIWIALSPPARVAWIETAATT